MTKGQRIVVTALLAIAGTVVYCAPFLLLLVKRHDTWTTLTTINVSLVWTIWVSIPIRDYLVKLMKEIKGLSN